jgi:hypothetical protein
MVERRRSRASRELQEGLAALLNVSVDDLFEPPGIGSVGCVDPISQTDAAALTELGMGQIRAWRRLGRIRVYGRSAGAVWFSEREVRDAAGWAQRSLSEQAVANRLHMLGSTVRNLSEAGELGEWREFAGRREYEREAVETYAKKRDRLISMRQACREFALPWWVLADLVKSGLIVATSGAKGAKLIDPAELKPMIEAVPCSVCGELAPPGRAQHADCKRRTKEARERARQKISRWWALPEAEAFRERIAQLPCPACGNPVRLPEPTLRARTNPGRPRLTAPSQQTNGEPSSNCSCTAGFALAKRSR